MSDTIHYTKTGREHLPQWKEDALVAAKELCYGEAVIQKIMNAHDEHHAIRILCGARNAK